MGITIGYSGKLDDPSRLSELIQEVKDFCQRPGWETVDFHDHASGVFFDLNEKPKPGKEPPPWPEEARKSGMCFRVLSDDPPDLIDEEIRGVTVKPPGTEWLQLHFNDKGRLATYTAIPSAIILNAVKNAAHFVEFPFWVKTTGAIESHIWICALLDILKKKYMRNLKVKDDSGFWKTRSLERLTGSHGQMGALIGAMSDVSNLNKVFKAAGMEELPSGTKIATNVPIAVPRRPKARKPRPV